MPERVAMRKTSSRSGGVPRARRGRGSMLAFRLEALGFDEETLGFVEVTGLMEGVAERGVTHHPLRPVAFAIGEINRQPGCGNRGRNVAEREVEFAEVPVPDGSVLP